MKKLLMITAAALFLTALIVNPLGAQTAQKPMADKKPIPADVMKIAEKACINCHAEPGNGMALMHVNLSNWDKYSPEKQADKAQAMCKMVSRDKMPPKSFKAKHPEAALSTDDLKTICDWAASLQVAKK